GRTYKVQGGDNPSTIAQKCGVDLQALLRANANINPNALQVGQELNIP
ncbi:MAG TPA: LysM domain-containing protein, partial [Dehalococcoidia bacterium]|nr:LysM domain-containing protein [Dehalococcoidia bacterium]